MQVRVRSLWGWTRVIRLRDFPLVRRLMAANYQPSRVPQRHEIYVRPLRASILLREGTSDARVLAAAFIGRYHLPPPEMPNPQTILDLGSNIGLTVAHYAVLFPHARVLGIELDPEAADLARYNISPWSDRCQVLSGAAWVKDEEVHFERVFGEEEGFHIAEKSSTSVAVPGFSLSHLVDQIGGTVDFLKMDIEGGEKDVLADNTDWASAVRVIKVEVHHGPDGFAECRRHLQELGFEVRVDEHHWSGLIALRI